MGFKVGQKVVCVKGERLVKKNEIYTISEVSSYTDDAGHYGIKVEEVVCTYGYNNFFKMYLFKPLELDYTFVEEVIKQVQPK